MYSLTLSIESYLKWNVDVELFNKLDSGGIDRFFKKCAIELSYDLSPMKNYGMSREEFIDMIADVFEKLYCMPYKINLGNTKLFCYQTPLKEYRLVIARTKKQAEEITCSFGFKGLRNALSSRKSLRRVMDITSTTVVLDNGEERQIESLWFQTVNLYDGGAYQ